MGAPPSRRQCSPGAMHLHSVSHHDSPQSRQHPCGPPSPPGGQCSPGAMHLHLPGHHDSPQSAQHPCGPPMPPRGHCSPGPTHLRAFGHHFSPQSVQQPCGPLIPPLQPGTPRVGSLAPRLGTCFAMTTLCGGCGGPRTTLIWGHDQYGTYPPYKSQFWLAQQLSPPPHTRELHIYGRLSGHRALPPRYKQQSAFWPST